MNKKYKLILTLFLTTIIFLTTITYFYYSYSNSLNKYNDEVYNSFNTLQNLIHKVHTQDSLLYKTLLLKDNSNFNSNFNNITKVRKNYSNDYYTHLNSNYNTTITDKYYSNYSSKNLISELLKLNTNPQFSSQKITSTIDEYYSLENLRKKIIQLNQINQSNIEIKFLLNKYENQINIMLSQIHEQIEFNKQKNTIFLDKLKSEFLTKEIILFILFITTIITILIITNIFNEILFKERIEEKKITILDNDMKNIINFIKKEINLGNFPTFKEVKKEINISHPTLILKIKKLEKENLISIRKKGRNKHIFLK